MSSRPRCAINSNLETSLEVQTSTGLNSTTPRHGPDEFFGCFFFRWGDGKCLVFLLYHLLHKNTYVLNYLWILKWWLILFWIHPEFLFANNKYNESTHVLLGVHTFFGSSCWWSLTFHQFSKAHPESIARVHGRHHPLLWHPRKHQPQAYSILAVTHVW